MKYFIIIIILILNKFIYAQTLYYKNVNTSEEDSDLMQVEFPEDCLEIIEISNDNSFEILDFLFSCKLFFTLEA